MKRLILVAILIAGAAFAMRQKPDPQPVEDPAATAATLRAEGEAAIRARRAELRAQREGRQRNRDRQRDMENRMNAGLRESEENRRHWEKVRRDARPQQLENYRRCAEWKTPEEQRAQCAHLHPDAPRPKPRTMEGTNAYIIP